MRYSDRKVRWFLDPTTLSNFYGKRSVNCFKNPMLARIRRAAANSGDFLFPVGLLSPVINSLKNMITLLILIPMAGCSFHSAQWESAKALWATRAPATQPGQETYWWDMVHEGQTYRLFPVAWNGKTVLTDAKRWMIVLQNSEVMMIRDFVKSQQLVLEVSADAAVGGGEIGGGVGGSGGCLDSSDSGVWNEVSIVESPIGKPMEIAKTTTLCLPPRLDTQSLRLITRCTLGGLKMEFQMAEFDQSGNIVRLRLNLLSNGVWVIYRSGDLVDAFEIKRYLDGDVDEI